MKTGLNKLLVTILISFGIGLPLSALAGEVSVTPFTDSRLIYLMPNSPTFEVTIPAFREKYNKNHPEIPLYEYRVVASKNISLPFIRAASKINEKIYSSAVLERGSEKIKSLQITVLPSGNKQEDEKNLLLAQQYIVALINQFEPTLTIAQAKIQLEKLLKTAESHSSFSQKIGAMRYIIVNSSENIMTFAIEPIKLSLSDTLTNEN
ncbi:DUF1454 family protein [Xenorhabdus szentirmaii]|uniref:DUF1454 family protein n=2 Tax=Xenorhabdus szentirmaii TaxID=290112 RepID=W1J227_9GAMM|nr:MULTISPECIES: DUF1454 family protein [Xenorhabdus]MBD2781280.1 DUF1454 family protein [Xenorhabdus sp. 38]MBD2792764.1 DUF1454 family protein [Xenorhabdus sp. CUL]MBD2800402.1 DUF1454 family protein [Xenorhabdus sp. M]MBD2804143.1 DUF1454 family protein [Xenorhabdus sp. ZM]MBD2820358.1 DUF1454 family protein [Xenorhabdus sp. 42]